MLPQVEAALKTAMLAGDTSRVSVLRMLKSSLTLGQKEAGGELTDEVAIDIARKQIKQRHDSASAYDQAGSPDKAKVEREEALIIQEFMPQQLTVEELTAIVDKQIEDSGLGLEKKNMGALIGKVVLEVGSSASKSDIAQIINQKISS